MGGKKENNDAVCEKCGRIFDNSEQSADMGKLYCSQCMIELAEEDIPEHDEVSKQDRIKTSKIWRPLLWVILAACLCVIVIRVPELISSFEKDKVLRNGTYETDEKTDQCIKDLWRISGLLQKGILPGDDMLSPASSEPYVVRKEDGDLVVSPPYPELYGFRKIRVSRKNPVPELIK